MLVYGFLGGVFSLVQLCVFAKFKFDSTFVDFKNYQFYTWLLLCLIVISIQAVYTLVSMFMGSKQLYMISQNLNTLENFKVINRDMYDLGKLYNLKDFFNNFVAMVLPIEAPIKYEGYYFNIRGLDPEFEGLCFQLDNTNTEPPSAEKESSLTSLIQAYKENEVRHQKKVEGPRIFIFNNVKITDN